MKEVQISFKGNIKKRERRRWSRAIETAFASLPDYEKRLVPKFKIYPNLFLSVADNYNMEEFKTDNTAVYLYSNEAWAYAKILSDHTISCDRIGKFVRDELFISLSIEKFRELTKIYGTSMDDRPPEFVIFHEIGHFHIQYRKRISTYSKNRDKVEFMADKYAMYALARMLYRNPEYKTISRFRDHIAFMERMKTMIQEETAGKNLSPAELRGKLMRVVNRVTPEPPVELEWRVVEKKKGTKYVC